MTKYQTQSVGHVDTYGADAEHRRIQVPLASVLHVFSEGFNVDGNELLSYAATVDTETGQVVFYIRMKRSGPLD